MTQSECNDRKELTDEEIERLPASFEIDYLSSPDLPNALQGLGAVLESRGPLEDGKVYAEGRMPDGTVIRMEVTKGKAYTSPKDMALVERERVRKAIET
ncbi:hypothetical protein COU76_05075 [Candidatus Peregrinibacteria bacterium CG10_big_fil_rev_8_21_14_0_10_49_10]|nr:MAG: hypothetical protein COU76_05075 [Candidatus Peregrinibacteria bacterium CG10_big_fil_rev_8_21_14_0_10_49_10]